MHLRMRLVIALFSRSLPAFYPFQAGLASLDGTVNTEVVWKPKRFSIINIQPQKKRTTHGMQKNNINIYKQKSVFSKETRTSLCALCGSETDEGLYLPGTLSRVCGLCWMKHRLDKGAQGLLARRHYDQHYDENGDRKDGFNTRNDK